MRATTYSSSGRSNNECISGGIHSVGMEAVSDEATCEKAASKPYVQTPVKILSLGTHSEGMEAEPVEATYRKTVNKPADVMLTYEAIVAFAAVEERDHAH